MTGQVRSGPCTCSGGTSRSRLAPLETRVGLALEHVERPHNRTVPRFSASAARPHLRSPPGASDIYMASGLDLPPRDS